ncbi:peptidoglycan-associated lipoprotein Pal [Kiloniella laminariae]|uniref:Peptidoglycan-associated lipoprotein n=1 Tax=Kiloniella laminariae TaxID=454162 RepID=A0ABT4LI78_9PROT|nr:peptidoglycan-associated lipoprotein Pal [Kiloniella laminariae]MCZ4280808.1 peptidoglycan-associated lipoprotein Pal [Kiloniella laminariae]
MRFKLLTMFAAALFLSACASKSDENAGGSNDGTAASTDQSSSVSSSTIQGPQPGTLEHLLVNVGDRVFFGYDQSDLSADSQKTTEALAVWLNSYPAVTLTLEGHADERGTREYNLALGERRANSVRDYLVALGVNPSRLQVVSFGKERPAVLGSTEEAWAQNRRAVFAVN